MTPARGFFGVGASADDVAIGSNDDEGVEQKLSEFLILWIGRFFEEKGCDLGDVVECSLSFWVGEDGGVFALVGIGLIEVGRCFGIGIESGG